MSTPKANRGAITALKAEYAARVAKLERKDEEAKPELEPLTATYTDKMTELEAADNATADELAALKTKY